MRENVLRQGCQAGHSLGLLSGSVRYDRDDYDQDFRHASRRSLIAAPISTPGFMVTEVVGAILSGSMAPLGTCRPHGCLCNGSCLVLLDPRVADRHCCTEHTPGFAAPKHGPR